MLDDIFGWVWEASENLAEAAGMWVGRVVWEEGNMVASYIPYVLQLLCSVESITPL
jgi:hypothetical protein